jgi:glycosyltransferase involved in cell wall biosynthesis
MLITQEDLNRQVLHRLDGVSGLMRVKNEERTVRQSVESVINVVDELVIIHHNCTDNTIPILLELAKKYPKISLYEYTQHVIPANTNGYVEGFDQKFTLANYYNFGLLKCKYKWVLKIDADQIYFEEELKTLFENKRSGCYHCMIGFNVIIDKNGDITVGNFENIPINGHHGDHFLTEIKIGSCFRIPKYEDGTYCQFEQYYEPGICWDVFDFSIGGAFWYHLRQFKELGLDFCFTEEEKNLVEERVSFEYLRSKLCKKYIDLKIQKVVECFFKNREKLNLNNFNSY